VTAQEAFRGIPQIEVRSVGPNWTGLRLVPDLALKELVVQFVRSELPSDLGETGVQLALALDELLCNAIEHGCCFDPACAIELTFISTPRMVLYQIRDTGNGFLLQNAHHAAVNNPPEEPLRHADKRAELGMRPGGFGILMVQKIADELLYNEQGNEVLFVKYLP
jgi:two-component system, OmpR family, response regulator